MSKRTEIIIPAGETLKIKNHDTHESIRVIVLVDPSEQSVEYELSRKYHPIISYQTTRQEYPIYHESPDRYIQSRLPFPSAPLPGSQGSPRRFFGASQ